MVVIVITRFFDFLYVVAECFSGFGDIVLVNIFHCQILAECRVVGHFLDTFFKNGNSLVCAFGFGKFVCDQGKVDCRELVGGRICLVRSVECLCHGEKLAFH